MAEALDGVRPFPDAHRSRPIAIAVPFGVPAVEKPVCAAAHVESLRNVEDRQFLVNPAHVWKTAITARPPQTRSSKFAHQMPPLDGLLSSHAARSDGLYRTAAPSLRNRGPCPIRRQRRTDANERRVMLATSRSVRKVSIDLPSRKIPAICDRVFRTSPLRVLWRARKASLD